MAFTYMGYVELARLTSQHKPGSILRKCNVEYLTGKMAFTI